MRTGVRTLAEANPNEELWVIVKPERAATPNDDVPGCGALMTYAPGTTNRVPVPLEHTDVDAAISGFVSSVNVKQRFHNPFSEKIEAVYVFPLPQNAAVNEFLMTVGARTIRGVIRDRQQAEQIYAHAKAQGHTASLLTQERPNIFTQKVANIEPGRRVDVDITYFNTLAYDDGWFEFVFPMVVGPRFNPPHTANAGHAPFAANIPSRPPQGPYLKPSQRSGHDIDVDVTIDAGVSVEQIRCDTHKIEINERSASRWEISLADRDKVPNRDFVLRYRVAGDQIKSGLVTGRGSDGASYFAMMLIPPRSMSDLRRRPVEFVFVLDCSGSMRGEPIAQAKRAAKRALDRLEPGDTFQIIRFSSNASALGEAPLLATRDNIREGKRYLDGLNSGGGTMMIEGIRTALRFPHDPSRLRVVTFMTDGFIGNEHEILSAMDRDIGAARVFSFGVGSSPNRFLMDRMAKVGRGAVAYVGLNDNPKKVMDAFFDRVSQPAMTDLRIDWGAIHASEVYPSNVPDLFVGRPVLLTGRFHGNPDQLRNQPVRVFGRAGDFEQTLTLSATSDHDHAAGLEPLWARTKIADLAERAIRGQPVGDVIGAIRGTALAHNLMSPFTSFVAVDSMSHTQGTYGVTVGVPVPVPQGVRYDTTVGPGG